jgi:thiamine-monophosphate kinase
VELRDVGEFGLIARIERAARRLPRARGVVLGIGDDAAVLRPRAGEDVVLTTDSLVQDVHFRLRDESPRTLGRRALVANLSDLAAMGARPLGFTVALVAPARLPLPVLDGLLAGLLREAAAHACPLVGGNLAEGRELSLGVAALGAVERGRELRRTGSRPGDRILVTGSLGRAALERARALRGRGRVRFVPQPRLGAGRALTRLAGVGGCIDVSDGLEGDLAHLLEPAGLAGALEPDRLPLARGLRRGAAALGLDPLRLALAGGEDYELLFTLRPGAPGAPALARRLGVAVHEIGRVVRRPRGRQPSPPGGWSHFAPRRGATK